MCPLWVITKSSVSSGKGQLLSPTARNRPGWRAIARLAYTFPFLIALQGLNGYNWAEFGRDVSLTCARFLA